MGEHLLLAEEKMPSLLICLSGRVYPLPRRLSIGTAKRCKDNLSETRPVIARGTVAVVIRSDASSDASAGRVAVFGSKKRQRPAGYKPPPTTANGTGRSGVRPLQNRPQQQFAKVGDRRGPTSMAALQPFLVRPSTQAPSPLATKLSPPAARPREVMARRPSGRGRTQADRRSRRVRSVHHGWPSEGSWKSSGTSRSAM
jgi:hypothetical protein